MYREGYTEKKALSLDFIHISDAMRARVKTEPGSVLVELKHEMAESLRIAAQKLSRDRDRMPPERPKQLIDFIAKYANAWPDQIALMRVIWDASNSAHLSGSVTEEEAYRMLAVADTLNESFVMGYSLDMRPNPDWDEEGAVCEYQHCIEHMPLPESTLEETVKWREGINKALEAGRYDDHPERKAEFALMLSQPVPDDLPEEVDTTGSCPVFGHFCPGGPKTVDSCETAHEWLVDLSIHAQRNDSQQPGQP